MNWTHFKKNVGRRFQLEPIPCYIDAAGNESPEISDDWEIEDITESDVIHIRNIRTGHKALLGKDHIYEYRSNPSRKDGEKEYGFLILKVHIFIQNDEVCLRPNSRPGERVNLYSQKRIRPMWTDFIKVDAYSGVPPTATTAMIQYRLWSDNENIPLMIRIASDAKAKFSQEASGPSGVIDLLLTEKQTFYVSLSHPHLHFELSVIGWSY
ncbi:MAG: hypothetical protein AABY58_04650 [Nitrospirota bacterium]|jgi:hypothetical protein